MARQLAPATLERLRLKLEEERECLSRLLAEHEHEREEARLAETAAERSPDPMTAEGGSMAFEFEKELSVDQALGSLAHRREEQPHEQGGEADQPDRVVARQEARQKGATRA